MIRKEHRDLIETERLKTLAFREDLARRRDGRRYNRLYFLTALGWALLAALPSVYVGRAIPYMLGAVTGNDIQSRTEFSWHDSAAEA